MLRIAGHVQRQESEKFSSLDLGWPALAREDLVGDRIHFPDRAGFAPTSLASRHLHDLLAFAGTSAALLFSSAKIFRPKRRKAAGERYARCALRKASSSPLPIKLEKPVELNFLEYQPDAISNDLIHSS